MKINNLTLAIIPMFFIACNSDQKASSTSDSTHKTEETASKDPHNAQNSLDWAGTYTGVTPCADCEGIQTELTLNPDMTYILKTNYMGRDTHFPEDRGTFKWDSTGSKVELIGLKDGPNLFFVGENTVRLLDMEGKEVTGPLADHYVLKKIK
ncbi:copper resistance protein NlpE [Pedobacter gandavensis]|uniref:Copper resistance protein NlpE n=1 Tax=Pedobacter gandavensis TaxID=2679963 RepID=A0ABR6EXH1_9SPHI|nr:copper resistance protein NlpE [Pedobacter gandavensis]MBB2149671.1 copper resistance protein NlpE [Pedobacter gandavensis]